MVADTFFAEIGPRPIPLTVIPKCVQIVEIEWWPPPFGLISVTAVKPKLKILIEMTVSVTPLKTTLIGQSDRLIVRTWSEDDAPEYFLVTQDDGFNHLSVRNYRQADLQTTQQWILNEIENFKKYGHGTCVVIERSSSRIVGICALKRLHYEGKDYIETMYRFVKSSWGQGYATEAVRLYFKYGFEILKMDEIIGIMVVQNDPSRKVLKKLGMSWVRNSTFSGQPVEIYSVKLRDWK